MRRQRELEEYIRFDNIARRYNSNTLIDQLQIDGNALPNPPLSPFQ
jgi:hypothetical protein